MKKLLLKTGFAVALSFLLAVCFAPSIALADDVTNNVTNDGANDTDRGVDEDEPKRQEDRRFGNDDQQMKQHQGAPAGESEGADANDQNNDTDEEQPQNTASVFSNGRSIFAVGVTAMAAFVLGIAGTVLYRRKKR